MGEAKHTPGKWYCEGGQILAPSDRVETRGPIRIAGVSVSRKGSAERDANARLLAAAPDLLAACEAVVRAWDGFEYDEVGIPQFDSMNRFAQAYMLAADAVAKARGEAAR